MEIGLAWVLKVAWIASILLILITSIHSNRVNSMHKKILHGFAIRGNNMPCSSRRFTVPQRFFLHFYTLGVLWTTLWLLATWHYAYEVAPLGSDSMHYLKIATHLTGGSDVFSMHKSHSDKLMYRYRVWNSVFMLLLMELHVVRRLYEAVYVFKYNSSARMHIVGYLTGLFFYAASTMSLCSFCAFDVLNFEIDRIAEFKVKGQNLTFPDFNLWGFVKPITNLVWFQWVGAVIFGSGWVHQYRCHAIIGCLRKQREHIDEYVIPHGDWFEFVSSPHYLAETIIYVGLLIASGGTDSTIWLFVGFVVVNLVYAVTETGRWYPHKFEGYSHNRRAIFPFIC